MSQKKEGFRDDQLMRNRDQKNKGKEKRKMGGSRGKEWSTFLEKNG